MTPTQEQYDQVMADLSAAKGCLVQSGKDYRKLDAVLTETLTKLAASEQRVRELEGLVKRIQTNFIAHLADRNGDLYEQVKELVEYCNALCAEKNALAAQVAALDAQVANLRTALAAIRTRAYGQADKVKLIVLMDWIRETCDKALARAE